MPPTPIRLDRAVVAITGGARGIGRSTAELFAAAGARVSVGDLDGDAAAEAASEIATACDARVEPFQLDVRSRDSFAEFLDGVHATLGPLDVLVNNAGVMPTGPFLAEAEATTDTVLEVNLRGTIHGMRLALPGMIERRRGHVVNVASMLGRIELPGLATYVASKHGVVGLTNAVRHELAGSGVTLTALLPGVVNTELSSGFGIPLARLTRVEPEDVAQAILDSVRDRPREVAVPRWMALLPVLRPLIPPPIEAMVRRLLGDDRAMGPPDPAGRAAYSVRLTRQSAED
jgi:NAD(P)-dependent dehydrogenase (short-subunit alcohol dehydrogenase family)